VSGGDAGARGAPRVGLIVNPFAGRDVRRLVAPAGSLSNYERAVMVRRLLAGLRATGVREVLYMPEDYGIVTGAAAESPGIAALPALERAGDVDPLAPCERDTLARAVPVTALEARHRQRAVERGVQGDGDDHETSPQRWWKVLPAYHSARARVPGLSTERAASSGARATSFPSA